MKTWKDHLKENGYAPERWQEQERQRIIKGIAEGLQKLNYGQILKVADVVHEISRGRM